jgi:exodeoxyribonuclease III
MRHSYRVPWPGDTMRRRPNGAVRSVHGIRGDSEEEDVPVLTIATVNVNGIRAASRRGIGQWLVERRPDVLCLQEVRADDDALAEVVGPGWHGVHERASVPGRAGVAVMTRSPPRAVRRGLGSGPGAAEFAGAGRWVEADLPLDSRGSCASSLTVISAYVPTGLADTPRQEEKHRFLDAVSSRLAELAADGRHVLLTGDLNVAHREVDLKNWKGNLEKAGFLPEERGRLDRLLAAGWVDVHRATTGPGPGPYTWWSWRGRAFDTDAGWRIDYQLATPGLADRVVKVEVDRAAAYAERWSDHAPVVAVYDLVATR